MTDVLQSSVNKVMADEQATSIVKAEIRATAKDIFVELLKPYLHRIVYEQQTLPESQSIKKLADLAARCAPYLYQSFGIITVNDDALWRKKADG